MPSRPASQLALANELGVDRTVMTYLLDELEAAGLLERRPDPSDRRARQVLITDTGATAAAAFRERLADAERHLLAPLDAHPAAAFRGYVERVARAAVGPCRQWRTHPSTTVVERANLLIMTRVWSAFSGVLLLTMLLVGVEAPNAGAAPVPATAPLPGGTWVAATPSHRVVDTRRGLGGSGPTRSVSVSTAEVGVPASGVEAVAVIATAVNPASAGYLTNDLAHPLTYLSYSTGRTTAGLVIAPASGGSVLIQSSRPVDLLVDVLGYFTDAAHAGSTGRYDAVRPTRVLDTNSTGRTVCSRCTASVRVSGLVPADSSVMVNTTVATPASGGYLTTFGSGSRPSTSTVNFATGQTVANHSIVPIGPDGTIHVYNGGGPARIIVDVSGYFTPDNRAGAYYASIPGGRLFDTRQRWSNPFGPLQGTTSLTSAGAVGLPFMSAVTAPVAVVGTLTATHGHAGWAVLHADGAQRPGVSDLNFATNTTQTALVAPTLGSDGRLALYSSSAANYLMDVLGYFASPATTPPHGAWAYGFTGRLVPFDGILSQDTSVPVTLFHGTASRSVAFDENYRYDLHTDGTVDRIVIQSGSQSVDPLFTGATAIATFQDGGIALRGDGSVWTWGTNDALGRPGVTVAHYPIQVPGISDAVAVAGGRDQAYVVRADGSLLAWGANDDGQLGDGSTTPHASPHPVPGVSGVATVLNMTTATFAIHTDGTVTHWGYWTGSAQQLTPTPVSLPCSAQVAVQAESPFFLCADGTVREYEEGAHIQPDPLNVPAGVVGIASAPYSRYPLLLLADGSVWRTDGVEPDYRAIPGIAQIAGINGTIDDAAMWTAS